MARSRLDEGQVCRGDRGERGNVLLTEATLAGSTAHPCARSSFTAVVAFLTPW